MLTVALICTMWAGGPPSTDPRPDPSDLVSRLAEDDRFDVLLALVDEAQLRSALKDEGPFTVLAPTDEAFAALPREDLRKLLLPINRDALRRILQLHVIEGTIPAARLAVAGSYTGLGGEGATVLFEAGRLRIGAAGLLDQDLVASNGLVHVIDTVLLPEALELLDGHPARQVLDLAIQRGVPLCNAGQVAACAAVYEVALRSLLSLESRPALDETSRRELARALERAEAVRDPAEAAWVLRRAMDELWRSLEPAAARRTNIPPGSPSMTPSEDHADTRSLFEFDRKEFAGGGAWFSVNDDVMGGVSEGGMQDTGASVGVFAGQLSRRNNGGFSTVRSRTRDLGLEGWEGLELRVRGDGRTYDVGVRTTDARGEPRSWRAPLETRPGEWQVVRLPFESMSLSVMGRRFPQDRPDPAQVRCLTFSLSDKDETPFRLEVDWIRAYRDEASTD